MKDTLKTVNVLLALQSLADDISQQTTNDYINWRIEELIQSIKNGSNLDN